MKSLVEKSFKYIFISLIGLILSLFFAGIIHIITGIEAFSDYTVFIKSFFESVGFIITAIVSGGVVMLERVYSLYNEKEEQKRKLDREHELWTRDKNAAKDNYIEGRANFNEWSMRSSKNTNLKLLEDAIEKFIAAAGKDPKNHEVHHYLALTLYERYFEYKDDNEDNVNNARERERARREARDAIFYAPDFAEAHNFLGVILCSMKSKYDVLMSEEAFKEFKRAKELAPNNLAPYNNLGIIYYHQEKIDEAIDEFKKAIEINPAYSKPYYNLGVALFEKDDKKGAKKEFEKAFYLRGSRAHCSKAENNIEAIGKGDEIIKEMSWVWH